MEEVIRIGRSSARIKWLHPSWSMASPHPAGFGGYRPDVAAAMGNTCPEEMMGSGVVARINTGELKGGAHKIQMQVTDERGHRNVSNMLILTVIDKCLP